MLIYPELVNEQVVKTGQISTSLHWININAGEAFKTQFTLKCFKVSNKLNLEI